MLMQQETRPTEVGVTIITPIDTAVNNVKN